MCAINGFTGSQQERIESMNQRTAHRGPDGSSTYLDEHISLGHNRLAIIDPRSVADQPMRSASGRYVLVYNGELYNFKDLRRELSTYSFKTESDTEVILASWEAWGIEALKRFNGIFALALWDTQQHELFLARDRSGVKPLYFRFEKDGLSFSSEAKALVEGSPVLNLTMFKHYTRLLYGPGPATLFEGISKLPPASVLSWSKRGYAITSFYHREASLPQRTSYTSAREQVRTTVTEAVKRQLVSDKPLGIYLSGGIDSSSVLAAASSVHPHIDTFSVGFDLRPEEQAEKFNADFLLARQTAQNFSSRHHEVLVGEGDIIPALTAAVRHLDEPISNPTEIAQFILSRYAKEKVDVVLGGDGGDELFGGYERYRLSLFASYYSALPNVVRQRLDFHPRLQKLNTPAGVDRFALFLFQKDVVLKRILKDAPSFATREYFEDMFFTRDPWPTFEEKLMDVDRQTWLIEESLMRTDKLSMAHGLEARVPLLDNEVIDLAGSLPRHFLVTPFKTKRILRDAFRADLPAFLYNQPKRGWFSPAAKWIRRPSVGAFLKEALSASFYERTSSLFNWSEIEKMIDEHERGERYHLTELWMVLTFQLWAREYNVVLP